MRTTRATVGVLAVLAALALPAGCGTGGSNAPAGSTSSGGGNQPGAPLSDLQNKIMLIEHDPCADPGHTSGWSRCTGRYSAQVDNISQAALALAGQLAEPGQVRHAAHALATASGTFQDACTAGVGTRCAGKLHTVDTRLRRLGSLINGGAGSAPPTTP